MNVKMILFTVVALTLATVSSSTATPRTWSKGTGNYDGSMTHRPTPSVRRSYRSVAPRMIEESPSPAAVANAPSTTRRYSYEPSAPSDSTRAAQAPSLVRSTRSYLFEPSNSASRMRTSRPSANSLPKSDPRRYNF